MSERGFDVAFNRHEKNRDLLKIEQDCIPFLLKNIWSVMNLLWKESVFLIILLGPAFPPQNLIKIIPFR